MWNIKGQGYYFWDQAKFSGHPRSHLPFRHWVAFWKSIREEGPTLPCQDREAGEKPVWVSPNSVICQSPSFCNWEKLISPRSVVSHLRVMKRDSACGPSVWGTTISKECLEQQVKVRLMGCIDDEQAEESRDEQPESKSPGSVLAKVWDEETVKKEIDQREQPQPEQNGKRKLALCKQGSLDEKQVKKCCKNKTKQHRHKQVR